MTSDHMEGRHAQFGEEVATGPRRGRLLEDDAIVRLLRHLASTGVEAEVLSRPDREGHAGRAVDAEMRVDGRLVALEVTQLLPGARAHYEIARLERQIEAHVASLVRDLDVGYVAIDVHYRRLPAKSELRAAVGVLMEEIEQSVRTLLPRPTVRERVQITSSVSFIRRLGLLQLPDARPGLGWIGGSDEFGGWVQPIADEFVDHLLATKASQTADHREVWVLIVDRVGVIGAQDVAQALTRKSGAIPANWSQGWFLPASDHSQVIALPLRGE